MKRIKFAAVALSLCVLLSICVGATDKHTPIGSDQSKLNICDMGAIPNDGVDDTLAFKLTLNVGEPVYVPPGVYDISESLYINSNMLIGAGPDKTVIVANMKSVREPIIWAGDRTQIRDLTLKFADGCVTGTEIAGERVGIVTTANGDRRLCRGAAITNVRIQNVGTGVYSPRAEATKATKDAGDGCAFSVTFESISVIDFSYRGVDMQAHHRTGNVYRNIYLSSGKYKANVALAMGEEESESSIADITVADSKLKAAVKFECIYGAAITNLNIINTELTEDNTAFLYLNQSIALINGFTVKNSAPKGARQAFIRVGEGAYRKSLVYDTNGFLKINNFSIINDDISATPDSAQYMLSRDNAYIHGFVVDIDNFNVSAPAGVKEQYESFRFDNRAIDLTVNGEKLSGEGK